MALNWGCQGAFLWARVSHCRVGVPFLHDAGRRVTHAALLSRTLTSVTAVVSDAWGMTRPAMEELATAWPLHYLPSLSNPMSDRSSKMPFRPHSTEQYNMLFHNFWCLRRPLEDAAKEAMMNSTHAFRAATGWSSGKDGAVGRTAFLAWIKSMKAPEGAPCCGGMMHPGKRKPRPFSAERLAEMERLRELESAHSDLVRELGKMRKALGLRVDQSVDEAPTGVTRDRLEADGPPER